MFEDLNFIFNIITQLTSGNAPWWVYVLIVFIPFSILLAIREGYCWFNKVNRVVSKLEKLDKRLERLNISIETLSQSISNIAINNQEYNKTLTKLNDGNLKDQFLLEKDWTNK